MTTSSSKGVVVTFGESVLCYKSLSVENTGDTSMMCRNDLGGSEFNTSVGLGTLGRNVRYLTVLPAGHAAGVISAAAHSGVDTSHVLVDDATDGEIGITFTAVNGKTTHQRRHSSFSQRVHGRDFDWTAVLKGAAVFHTTGITPSLSEATRVAWLYAIRKAAHSRVPIFVDLNWKPNLIDLPTLWQIVRPVTSSLTVLHLTEFQLTSLAMIEHRRYDAKTPEKRLRILSWLRQKLRVPLLVCSYKSTLDKIGSGWQKRWSAVAYSGGVLSTASIPVHHRPSEWRGASDAWAVGFLDAAVESEWFGYKSNGNFNKHLLRSACRRGDILCALSQESPGPACLVPRSAFTRVHEANRETVVIGMAADISTRAKLESAVQVNPFLPEITCENIDDCDNMCRALFAGGARIVMVSFASDNAAEALTKLVLRKPKQLVLGASNITNPDVAHQAVTIGAEFLSSTGLSVSIYDAAQRLGVPYYPGVCTASEALTAEQMGLTDVILFPMEQIGGLPALRRFVTTHPRLRWIPCGSFSRDEAEEFLKYPQVLGCEAPWVTDRQLTSSRNWSEVTRLMKTTISDTGRKVSARL
eukprot:TRINITY_DN2256_c0_g1_i2.p1 TRINITY_DN2256_c0_g1~~TRINITY_DN2256_c0_g1_i2.p1  ORF type:complete len:583 (+),score=98.94 TRINITY_DN2256_c0_g1_i2:104-1852(+)